MTATRHAGKLISVAALTGVLLVVSAAHANQYYFGEDVPGGAGVRATYVFTAQGSFTGGTYVQMKAIADQVAGDPVMYFTRGSLVPTDPGSRWYDDDGCGDGSTSACINLFIPANDTYFVQVHAYSPDSGGWGGHTFYLMYNMNGTGWQRWGGAGRSWPLGGYAIYSQQPITTLESYETVLLNDGPAQTVMMRYDYDSSVGHYWPTQWDYTSGVGDASKLWGQNQWAYFVTSSAAPIEGRTRVVRNDALLADTDGDGLGDNLEIEACTCPYREYGTLCGFPCYNAKAGGQDTDGDGLRDDWELLGLDDASKPQLLPKWGANRRHKDIFVEVDRDGTCASSPFLRTEAESAAARFSSITGMNNPDGIDGIAAHFDIHEDSCNNEPGDIDGISNVCGYFGGSSLVPTTCNIYAPTMDPVRIGMFHWAERNCSSSGTSPNGIAYTSCFEPWAALPHELGHNFGLQHWGADTAGIVNNKPNYPSLMNYTYSYQRLGNEANIAFSDGARAALNPMSVNEDSAYSAGADISFMLGTPFFFNEHGAPGSQLVDWNRNGLQEAGPVRAAISEAPNSRDNTGYDHPIMQEIEDMPDSNSTLAPSGARYTSSGTRYTYVVVNDATTHKFKYTRSQYRIGTWSSYVYIGTTVHLADAQPSVVSFDAASGGARLVVFGADSSSRIQYASLKGTKWSSWTVLANPAGKTFKEVSAAVMGSSIYLVARDIGTDDIYHASLTASFVFSGWTAATSGGAPIRSDTYTPGLAAGPDSKLYMGVKAVAGRPRATNLELWEYNGGVWSLSTAGWNDSGVRDVVLGRPAMLFRRYVDVYGNQLANGTGAIYVWYPAHRDHPVSGAWETRPTYRWTWGTFNAGTQTFDMGWWHQPRLYNATVCGDVTMFDTGFGLVDRDDPFDRNLEAFMPHGPVADCGWHTNDTVHAPHADAEFAPSSGRLIADYNDYSVIGANLCVSLGHTEGECLYGFSGMAAMALLQYGPPHECMAKP